MKVVFLIHFEIASEKNKVLMNKALSIDIDYKVALHESSLSKNLDLASKSKLGKEYSAWQSV